MFCILEYHPSPKTSKCIIIHYLLQNYNIKRREFGQGARYEKEYQAYPAPRGRAGGAKQKGWILRRSLPLFTAHLDGPKISRFLVLGQSTSFWINGPVGWARKRESKLGEVVSRFLNFKSRPCFSFVCFLFCVVTTETKEI